LQQRRLHDASHGREEPAPAVGIDRHQEPSLFEVGRGDRGAAPADLTTTKSEPAASRGVLTGRKEFGRGRAYTNCRPSVSRKNQAGLDAKSSWPECK